jgi:hypothetical protein
VAGSLAFMHWWHRGQSSAFLAQLLAQRRVSPCEIRGTFRSEGGGAVAGQRKGARYERL